MKTETSMAIREAVNVAEPREPVARCIIAEQLFADICFQAHKHEVQTWRDAPGTDEDKLKAILGMARDGLALMRGTLRPEDC